MVWLIAYVKDTYARHLKYSMTYSATHSVNYSDTFRELFCDIFGDKFNDALIGLFGGKAWPRLRHAV